MRHAPYAIGPVERDEWLLCMRQALAEQVADEALRSVVERAFVGMAEHMVNTSSAGRADACRR
jgi:hemoglobin